MTTTPKSTRASNIVSTAIPYVNASPHLGFALEAVITDAIARARRLEGHHVHHQSGTDDNSLKNARAAAVLGVSTHQLVNENADRFFRLAELLDLSWQAFVRTSGNPVHQHTVEQIWNRCQRRGDIYRGTYDGLYCVGCEQFYLEDELRDGRCPEHGTAPEQVREENYFFRLSRYQDELHRLVSSNQLRILPNERRNEVLRLIEAGLRDFSISRSRKRARDWGLPVPDDPSQVIYVWFDALTNYVSGLGENGLNLWNSAGRIEHVIGKGILRFHAVYWPAILLSAGLRLPTDILIHGYLTVEGRKIGKSLGNAVDPAAVVGEFGVEPVRFYLLRHVHTTRDGDFSRERLVAAHDGELADQLGNLVHRTVSLIGRYRDGFVPTPTALEESEQELAELARRTAREVAGAVETFALHEALASIWRLVAAGNCYVDRTRPWALGKAERNGEHDCNLDLLLYTLADLIHSVGLLLRPFLPATANEILRRIGADGRVDEEKPTRALEPGARVKSGPPLFPKRSHLSTESARGS